MNRKAARGAVMGGALLTALVLGGGPARAGGGGCYVAAITQDTGHTIELKDACFTPTILQVQPGDQVTWVNGDPLVHNVTASTWGHFDDLHMGDSFTATFDAPGIYPYACQYHPGMSGAIVVGDGIGAGNGDTVTVEPFSALDPLAGAVDATTPEPETSSGWVGAGAIGLLLGGAVGVALRGVRRRVTGS